MQARSYYQRNKLRIQRRLRQTRLTTSGGIVIRGLRKRPRPNSCPLCGHARGPEGKAIRLEYHHWIPTYPEIGVWLCYTCHRIAEYLDNPDAESISLNYRNLQEEAKRKSHEIFT